MHRQIPFPDPSGGTEEIRRWAAIYPLMRLPPIVVFILQSLT